MARDRSPAPVSPLTSLARHWLMATALVLVGALLGLGAARSRPTSYTAEARVAVGSQSLSAQTVPGFAAGVNELAANFARYVDQAPTRSDLDPRLRDDDNTVTSVSASPIPDSSIIRVEVTATSAARARVAAQQVADGLVRQANARTNFSADALRQYQDVSRQLAEANSAVGAAQAAAARLATTPSRPDETAVAQSRLTDATVTANSLQVQQQALAARYQALVQNETSAADLSVVRTARATGDDFRSRLELYELVGGTVGGLLALVLATARDRRRTARASSRAATRELAYHS